MDWTEWKGKCIFIKLITGDCYTGKCIDADDSFLEMIDKYNNKVTIALPQIIKIVEEKR